MMSLFALAIKRWRRVQVKEFRLSREGRVSGGPESTVCCLFPNTGSF